MYLAPSGESCRNIMMARYVNLLLLILLRVNECYMHLESEGYVGDLY